MKRFGCQTTLNIARVRDHFALALRRSSGNLHFVHLAPWVVRPRCFVDKVFARRVFVGKPRRTCVLVADASRARLYLRNDSASKIKLVEEFEHPESRAKVIDLMADKPGRTSASGPQSHARSSQEYRTDPKQVEAQKFARELSRRLSALFVAHVFEDVVVAAPPKFLGLLRSALGTHHDHVSTCVVAWHEKDYTAVTDINELSTRLSLTE